MRKRGKEYVVSKLDEAVYPVRVLCGFEHSADPEIKPTGLYHKYFKVKMGVANRVWVVKSSKEISSREYDRLVREDEEGKQKKNVKLSKFTPPPNPWRFR